MPGQIKLGDEVLNVAAGADAVKPADATAHQNGTWSFTVNSGTVRFRALTNSASSDVASATVGHLLSAGSAFIEAPCNASCGTFFSPDGAEVYIEYWK